MSILNLATLFFGFFIWLKTNEKTDQASAFISDSKLIDNEIGVCIGHTAQVPKP